MNYVLPELFVNPSFSFFLFPPSLLGGPSFLPLTSLAGTRRHGPRVPRTGPGNSDLKYGTSEDVVSLCSSPPGSPGAVRRGCPGPTVLRGCDVRTLLSVRGRALGALVVPSHLLCREPPLRGRLPQRGRHGGNVPDPFRRPGPPWPVRLTVHHQRCVARLDFGTLPARRGDPFSCLLPANSCRRTRSQRSLFGLSHGVPLGHTGGLSCPGRETRPLL